MLSTAQLALSCASKLSDAYAGHERDIERAERRARWAARAAHEHGWDCALCPSRPLLGHCEENLTALPLLVQGRLGP